MESILFIRFSIEKLNELPGPYEFQEGFLIGMAVPAGLMNGMTVMTGDTLKTLRREEYISLVAIVGDREALQREIEPRIILNEEILKRKAEPFTLIENEMADPLSTAGMVLNGEMDETGWCSKGFIHAWKQRTAPCDNIYALK